MIAAINADSIVANEKDRTPLAAPATDLDPRPRLFTHELGRILHQILQHLHHLALVGPHRWQIVRDLDRDRPIRQLALQRSDRATRHLA